MTFADTKSYSDNPLYSTRRKVTYMELTPGVHLIRLLEDNAKRFFVHWINNTTIECLDEDCPICENNVRLMRELSKDKAFRNAKDWSPPTKKFFVNVMDRTTVKVCGNPQCSYEVTRVLNTQANKWVFPSTCPKCNGFVSDVEPTVSNKIKVLGKGTTLFDDFNTALTTELDDDMEPRPITSYDFAVSSSGSGRDTKVKATPQSNRNDKVEFNPEDLYDLSSPVIRLTREEVLDFKRGVSLKDLFTARKAEEVTGEATEKAEVTESVSKDILDEIFNG